MSGRGDGGGRGDGRGRAGLLVACVAILAGLPSLDAGFVHDDHRLIEQNLLIRDLQHPGTILTRGYWTVDATSVPNLYRPVTILSFAANRALLGAGPVGYRAVDLLLHAVAAVLVFFVARRFLPAGGFGAGDPDHAGDRRVTWADDGGIGWFEAPLLAGLLFAVHPIHTEAIGLVVGRAEILAAIGALGSVLLFLAARRRAERGHPRGARRGDVAALLLFAFGFLAKENAVVTPLLVALADAARLAIGRRRGAPDLRPAYGVHATFLVVLAGLLAARTAVLGMVSPAAFTHFVDNPIPHLPFPASTATALLVVARYARVLVAPFGLSLEYSYAAIAPARSLAAPAVLIGALLVAGVLGGAVFLRRRHPEAAFGLGFLAVAFAPVSNLVVPIGTIMAERLLYLPSAGFVLLAAGVLAPLAALPDGQAGGRGGARAARAGVTALLFAGALLSGWRLRDFHDDLTLQARTVLTTPKSIRAQFNYGAALERAGDDAAAEQAYRRAIAIWPDFADAQFNLAGLLVRRQRFDEALAHYDQAIAQQPGSVSYLVNYAYALIHAGRSAEAIEPLERALDIERDSDRAWNNLGGARLALGQPAEAARAWREAIRIAPDNAEYAVNLALALDAAGDPGAAAAWSDAVARRPEDGLLRYRLGRALERAGREDEAVAAYRESARLTPASPVPRRALGMLLHRRGDDPGARAALEEAWRLDAGGSSFDAEARALYERLQAAAD